MDLIEVNGGRASTSYIAYALTLEGRMDDGLFEDIQGELKALEEAGKLADVGKNKYELGETATEPVAAETEAEGPVAPRKGKKPSAEDRSALEEKMAEAFGAVPMNPHKRRKRQQTPHRGGRRYAVTKRVL